MAICNHFRHMDLCAYLKSFPNQREAARVLDVTQGTISHWISGRRRPRPEKAWEIVERSRGKVKLADIYQREDEQ
jgi:DNA-binding transcriptional regulator YdaS (Cro superfamily)